MITIIKRERSNQTFSHVTVEEFVKNVKGMQYEFATAPCSACFVAEYAKRNGEVIRKGFNTLLLLSISHLPGKAEVDSLFEDVKHIPYTHIAWRELTTNTVRIVSCFACQEEQMPDNEELMKRYLGNAYKQLHYQYSSQLRMSMDTEQPTLQTECPCVHDEEIYYNPDSIPMFVDDRDIQVPTYKNGENAIIPKGTLPGMNSHETKMHLYHLCLEQSNLEARKMAKDQEQLDAMRLHVLAEKCCESGLPMDFAVSLTLSKVKYCNREVLVRKTFETAYEDEVLGGISFGVVDKSALLTMRIDAYLKAWYELRKNVLSGVVQWRERSAYDYDFRDMTEEDMNSITIRALKAGLGSWDKDIHRLIHSNDIPSYDPLEDYISNLPKWDGKDRVAELAGRIPTDHPHLEYCLHVWLLSMVAHWLGRDRIHGNAVVPLLIGHQGCGKSTFAGILLPECLRKYYNDKVDFRSEGDIMSALSNFALINIDEFDSLKKSQQPTLKYLLSKGEVKVRPVYGRSIVERRRYASFIATTNLKYPLLDHTGSRRFVCIRILPDKSIDTYSPIEYDQLYAQLYAEIQSGKRYWFDEEDTAKIQAYNKDFQFVSSYSEIIDLMFCKPKKTATWKTVDEIIEAMISAYPHVKRTNNINREIGRLLREKGYERKKTASCMTYNIVIKEE